MVKKKVTKEVSNPVQFCLDGTLVDEVLPMVKGVDIIGCNIRFGMPIKRQKIVVPTKLKKFGVNKMSEIKAGLEAEIVLDSVTPAAVKKAVKNVAQHVGCDPKSATFRYITLSNGTASCRFDVTSKEMAAKGDDAADLRKKAKVLGAGESNGKIQSLFSDIGAEKFRCDFETVIEKRIAICKKEA